LSYNLKRYVFLQKQATSAWSRWSVPTHLKWEAFAPLRRDLRGDRDTIEASRR
jgi:hypothetical protein